MQNPDVQVPSRGKSRFSGPEQFSQNFCWRAVDFARQKTVQNLGKSQNLDFFIHHKPAKISQNLDFFIPKHKTKIQEDRKISIFSSPRNDENSRKAQNPDFSSHPKTAKISNFSSTLKSKNPGFFVPHSLKSARARRGSRSGAKRAEAGPAVQARKCAGGARQGKRRAAAHAILAEDP